jgi:CRP-like cAMP-binding protein
VRPTGNGSQPRPRNQILSALTPEEYARLEPDLERVSLEIRDLLFDVNQPIEYVYFPENSVNSIIGLTADGAAVETATIGDEGMVGLPLFHGTDRMSSQAFCQVPGEALRMPAAAFLAELDRRATLERVLHRYAQALFTLVAQSSACNRLHTMQQRCARWLLHTHDRVGYRLGVHEFPLTQQFLSQMIGVRRATVTAAMGALQDLNAISYSMGRIVIRDRGRLEAAVCDCYAIIRSEFDRLLGDAQFSDAAIENPLDRLEHSHAGKTTVGDAVPQEEDLER